jgi:hypothetical protein
MTMSRVRLQVSLLALSVLASSLTVADDRGSRPSFGIDVGYFTPSGNWTSHRYAAGVDQFRGGFSIGTELEFRFFALDLALYGRYTRFNVDDWTDYARSMGDQVSASASMIDSGMLMKFYFIEGSRDRASLGLGLTYYGFNGDESFGGYSYSYDFLVGNLGYVLELGYKRLLSDEFALAAAVRCNFLLEGVRYADGEKYDIIGIPVTLGIRRLF